MLPNDTPYSCSSDLNNEEIDEFIKDEEDGRENKNNKFYITLTPQLNASAVRTFYVSKYPISLGILFSKSSNIIQFQIDTEAYPIKNKIVQVSMFRKLEDSIFRNMFLKMERIQEGDIDFKYNLLGIRHMFSNRIIQIINEKMDLSYNFKRTEEKRNELELIGWKLQDIDNDLLYLLVQRKFFNKVSRIYTIRSYAIQLYTERGEKVLNRYFSEFEKMKGKDKQLDFNIYE